MSEVKGKIESLEALRERLREFARERDWDQYHTPKNLSMALIAEAAELVEHFQWVEGEVTAPARPNRSSATSRCRRRRRRSLGSGS